MNFMNPLENDYYLIPAWLDYTDLAAPTKLMYVYLLHEYQGEKSLNNKSYINKDGVKIYIVNYKKLEYLSNLVKSQIKQEIRVLEKLGFIAFENGLENEIRVFVAGRKTLDEALNDYMNQDFSY